MARVCASQAPIEELVIGAAGDVAGGGDHRVRGSPGGPVSGDSHGHQKGKNSDTEPAAERWPPGRRLPAGYATSEQHLDPELNHVGSSPATPASSPSPG